tara:strand:- start:955 stop:1137 length:183 start_codon:yes stop_codon:yes gene_type:complete
MNSELNGQYCHLCKEKIARPEAYCGGIYLCDGCATVQIIINDSDEEQAKQKENAANWSAL